MVFRTSGNLDVARAMATSGGFDRDLQIAIGTVLGRRVRCWRRLFPFHFVDSLNQDENCESDNEEIDNRIDKQAIIDGDRPGRLCDRLRWPGR